MGMDCYVYRIKDKKINTLKELGDYENFYGVDNEEKLLYFRRHYWIDNFFRKECTYSCGYDEVVLTKQDIEKFIHKFEPMLVEKNITIDLDSFYTKDPFTEIEKALESIKRLLEIDFEKDTVFYDSCS